MPSTYSFGVQTTSAAVSTTAMSPAWNGAPFTVTSTYGALVSETAVPVATQGTSALVSLVAYTSSLPDA